MYWIKTSRFIKRLFPSYIWDYQISNKTVYITFDDGPIPNVTPWVLDQLDQYNAKATFFCIGDNVVRNEPILHDIIARGHTVGNHTQSHINGWSTPIELYLNNVQLCSDVLASANAATLLFRPPYGKIKKEAAKSLQQSGYKIIMWDVLSADFDQSISPKKCLQNVIENIVPGSILVFHDSEKAFKNLEYALPRTLEFLKRENYKCEAIS